MSALPGVRQYLARRRVRQDRMELMSDLQQRLEDVRSRMARAAEKTKRDPADITLIAVTKIFPASAIREAHTLGLREFGENYVQEFEDKYPDVCDLIDARFHLIGHLQSNKAKR